MRTGFARATIIGTCLILAAIAGIAPLGREPAAFGPLPPRVEAARQSAKLDAAKWRTDALRRASVWQPTDPSTADLFSNPPDPTGTLSQPIVRCRFLPRASRGTSAKFDCVLADGEVVKVKYAGGEVRGELAATRLLSALGFGADRMFLVPRVRCFGCPRFPFHVILALDYVGGRELIARHLPERQYTDFEWVAVERRFEGTEIVAGDTEGWAWFELEDADANAAARRAEHDAFRLIAILLAHWDNKSENQRLVCVGPSDERAGRCAESFAIIQDAGSTFGPNKVDLGQWAATPMWQDAGRCLVSMRQLPYGGATFPDRQISEAGRELIARQLAALDTGRIASLFEGARFENTQAWVEAFEDKVRQIATAGPCPS